MELTINRDYREAGKLPLFHQYEGQTQPQPAYLEVEADGEVRVDWNGEIGNAVPFSVWHKRTLRYDISNQLTVAGIDALIEDIAPLIEEMLDHFEIVWDGNNNVGRLDERGADLDAKINDICRTDTRYYYGYEIGDAVGVEWFYGSEKEVIDEYRNAEDKAAWFKELKDDLWEAHNAIFEDEEEILRWLEESTAEEDDD